MDDVKELRMQDIFKTDAELDSYMQEWRQLIFNQLETPWYAPADLNRVIIKWSNNKYCFNIQLSLNLDEKFDDIRIEEDYE
jgi:hypothetical protein